MRRGLTAWAIAAAVVGLVSGCAGAGGDTDPDPYLTAAVGEHGPGTPPAGPGIYPLVPATHAHVQLTCPLVPATHYDPKAIPLDSVDGVYVCTTQPWDDAYDGTPQIEEFVDRVATEDIPGLLDAYATADAETPEGTVCAAYVTDPLIIWIHYGDEQRTAVYAPMDECHHPQEAAAATYHALDLHRLLVAREKLTP